MRRYVFAAILTVSLIADLETGAPAAVEHPIYTFAGSPDGANPISGVVVDSKTGAIYGTTAYGGGASNAGTVFELIPPSAIGGTWTERIIHSFGPVPDGANPGLVTEDPRSGALYVAASSGGAYDVGAVFEMIPPSIAGGSWTEAPVHSFGPTGCGSGVNPPPCTDGAVPLSALALDSSGNLYGTTGYGGSSAAGVLFELSPPKSQNAGWTETIAYNFASCPSPNLALWLYFVSFDLLVDVATGNLYGSGDDCGSGRIFQLTPPANAGGVWTETDLHIFPFDGGFIPSGALATLNGNIYGTTVYGGEYNQGSIFVDVPSISPVAAGESTLYSFLGGADSANPVGGLVAGRGPLFYGTTRGGGSNGMGTIFTLFYADRSWVEDDLYDFQGGMDGATPLAGLTVAPSLSSNDKISFFGTTASGGANNNGTVFVATFPIASGSVPPSLSAICDISCLENSLRWRLGPPLAILSREYIPFDAVVEEVTRDGVVVEFVARRLSSTGAPSGPTRKLTVTFQRAQQFKRGDHLILVVKGPLIGLSPKLGLVGFWRFAATR